MLLLLLLRQQLLLLGFPLLLLLLVLLLLSWHYEWLLDREQAIHFGPPAPSHIAAPCIAPAAAAMAAAAAVQHVDLQPQPLLLLQQ